MRCKLRFANEYLDDAVQYSSKKQAIAEFSHAARQAARWGDDLTATLHILDTKHDAYHEYPDFLLSLGKRGGVKIEEA